MRALAETRLCREEKRPVHRRRRRGLALSRERRNKLGQKEKRKKKKSGEKRSTPQIFFPLTFFSQLEVSLFFFPSTTTSAGFSLGFSPGFSRLLLFLLLPTAIRVLSFDYGGAR